MMQFRYIVLLVITCSAFMWAQYKYPETRKTDVTDQYFGVSVADPYRWLEDDRAPEVEAWVTAQNEVTFGYLNTIPFREALKSRMESLMDYPRYSAPFQEGEYYYFYKNSGLQNQSVLYRQKGLEGAAEVYIDPNTFSEDGTVKLSSLSFSEDQRYTAYSVSRSGSDWQDIFVLDNTTGKRLHDSLAWVKFSGADWYGNGFFYSRYDAPASQDKAYSEKNLFHKVYYHTIGDPQEKDKLVYQDTTQILFFSVSVSDDNKFLFLFSSGQGRGNTLAYKKLEDESGAFRNLKPTMEDKFYPVDNKGDIVYIYTTMNAPNGKMIAVDLKNPAPENWKDVIPESELPLKNIRSAGGKVFVTYMKDVTDRLFVYSFDGTKEREVTLPSLGSISGVVGKPEAKEVFFTFTSFVFPPTILRYEINAESAKVFQESETRFNPAEFETVQVFYPSKDSVMIPMFLVHKKGMKLEGNNPTLLYGYGGFNVSLSPWFDPLRIAWLEQGGVFAVANLRGGGEYGEAWHTAGTKLNKQNVFNDYIAAAEWLISNRYTSSDRLAINGGSNGGLLVGAAMCQRPELFKVAIPEVGVMDMLRYHRFTIGWNWASDYGTSDDEENFKNLYAYSPLHNLKKGTAYPATLITTADHDDRVVPAHSFKFAAALQDAHTGSAPVMIRIDTKSGHGASSTKKRIESVSDVYSFIMHQIGMTPVW